MHSMKDCHPGICVAHLNKPVERGRARPAATIPRKCLHQEVKVSDNCASPPGVFKGVEGTLTSTILHISLEINGRLLAMVGWDVKFH